MKTYNYWLLVLSACFLSLTSAALSQTQQPLTVIAAVAPKPPLVMAVQLKAQEAVFVEVQVNEQGAVTSAKAIAGPPVLTRAAQDAALRWRFNPGNDTDKIRSARLAFIYSLLPKNTPSGELGAIFTPPYKIEIRELRDWMVVRMHMHESTTEPKRKARRSPGKPKA